MVYIITCLDSEPKHLNQSEEEPTECPTCGSTNILKKQE